VVPPVSTLPLLLLKFVLLLSLLLWLLSVETDERLLLLVVVVVVVAAFDLALVLLPPIPPTAKSSPSFSLVDFLPRLPMLGFGWSAALVELPCCFLVVVW
jgi:hypothetical protein